MCDKLFFSRHHEPLTRFSSANYSRAENGVVNGHGLPTSNPAFRRCTSLTNVTIPDSVTSIEDGAFGGCGLTSVTISSRVIHIGNGVFTGCSSLTAITVDALNSFYCSVDGVLFDKGQTTLMQCPSRKSGSYTVPTSVTSIVDWAFSACTNLTGVTIPASVTSIGDVAFYACSSLTSITIPDSVNSIGDWAFAYCAGLTRVYFEGNAPSLGGSEVFGADNNTTVYYLPGTTGWGTTFGGRPTTVWLLPNPLILTSGPSFGVQTNGFGFIISWAAHPSVVVEACTSLANPTWSPVATNILTGGYSYFGDPAWTNHAARFYRLRSP